MICYYLKVLHALLAWLTVTLFWPPFLELCKEIDKDGYIYIRGLMMLISLLVKSKTIGFLRCYNSAMISLVATILD
jgi:hypothetical protein